jgi:site-specific recombinase XerD
MPLVRDELGHKSLSTTERYCDIPIKRLEDDFPTYAKVAKNGIMETLSMETNALEMRSLVEK